MSHADPLVTVLMPVHNGEQYIAAAMDSILCQSFSNFEFLVMDDGSTDSSSQIVRGYRDSRIRLVSNEANLGVTATLNRGISLANGRYVARMDCDDISQPERLRKQFDFMEANPHVGVCGSRVRRIGAKRGLWKVKSGDAAIKSRLLFENAMAHPSVMIRKSVLTGNNLRYDSSLRYAQDYAFWVELARYSQLANLEDVLVLYRVHAAQISEAKSAEQRSAADRVRTAQLKRFGIDPTPDDLILHGNISTYGTACDRHFVEQAAAWLSRLATENARSGFYGEPEFSEELAERWCKLCRKSSRLGLWTWKIFRSAEPVGIAKVSSGKKVGLFCRSLFHEFFR